MPGKQLNNPVEPGSSAAGTSGRDAKNQRYWFHILAQNTPAARNLHAAKLVDKAWQQGDRVCVLCDNQQQAQELDDLLWNFTPDAFIPHSIATDANTPCSDPVGILLYPPAASDWDTVIILSSALPGQSDQYRRLALVAQNDPAVLNQARGHYKQLRKLGIEARVHDMRKR
ncbi:DNA polymerase III subunit chi [Marinobacter sp.]|uniref:DNA polymerase III subunit chi n=1 Tax=Marinobacter sp. TaxID=50741 RepID=UPI0035622DE9